jgi:Zn-dependent metalloprotease
VALGWSKGEVDLQARSVRRSRGRSFLRFEQRYRGLRVFGAGVVVQVEPSGGIGFVLADIARDDAAMHTAVFSTTPVLDSGAGAAAALALVASERPARDLAPLAPELMIFEPTVVGSAGPSRLVWFVRVRGAGGEVNEVVLVDAGSGEVAFHYSDVKHAKNREIYDAANVPGSLGTLVRTEVSGPSGIPEAELAFQNLGDTYDFYFGRFGRDSFDGAGATLLGRVRYCEPAASCPYPNAYWTGSEMRFGDSYAGVDDVVAHELTHAVTERESNLIYWGESGAISEALSDIFGEFVDLTNTTGDDDAAVRWLVGEDLPVGAIRNMSDPTVFGDPDRRFSPYWYTGSEDNRGVHFNSGVANKLAFLLTDGGTFNGQTVVGLGLTPVAELFYEAQVNLLVPASDFYDLDAVLLQAANNLAWPPEAFDSLQRARSAVEISGVVNPATLFQDDFEDGFPGSWQVSVGTFWGPDTSGVTWGQSTYRQLGGSASAYCAGGGTSPPPPGTAYPAYMDGWMVYGPFSLAQAPPVQAAWAEFDLFLDIEYPFDEVFWGVSLDGQNFDGFAVSPGPDGLTPGWVHEVFNFKEVQSTPVLGQGQVWFAFNFRSDNVVEYEGTYIDSFRLHRSPSPDGGYVPGWPPNPPPAPPPGVVATGGKASGVVALQ